MRLLTRTLTLLATAPLVLTGCSTSEDAASGPSGASTTAASKDAAGTTDTAKTASVMPTASKTASSAAATASASKTELTLTVGGKKTGIKPTAVYCSGSKGQIRHIIGKTNHRPPLIEANGTHFVMAKIGQGKPYRSEQPTGVTYAANSVTFHQVSLGSAVLDGTMACTSWNN